MNLSFSFGVNAEGCIGWFCRTLPGRIPEGCTMLHLSQRWMGVYLALHMYPHQHLVLSAILTMWVMISQCCLLCCSWQHMRVNLLHAQWTFFVCYLFELLLHFNLGYPFSCWVSRILCISWINVLYHMCLLQIFSARQAVYHLILLILPLTESVCKPAYQLFLLWIVPLVIVTVHLVSLTGFPTTKEVHSSGYLQGGVSKRFNWGGKSHHECRWYYPMGSRTLNWNLSWELTSI